MAFATIYPPFPPPLDRISLPPGDPLPDEAHICTYWTQFWALDANQQINAFSIRPGLFAYIRKNHGPLDQFNMLRVRNQYHRAEIPIYQTRRMAAAFQNGTVDPYLTGRQIEQRHPELCVGDATRVVETIGRQNFPLYGPDPPQQQNQDSVEALANACANAILHESEDGAGAAGGVDLGTARGQGGLRRVLFNDADGETGQLGATGGGNGGGGGHQHLSGHAFGFQDSPIPQAAGGGVAPNLPQEPTPEQQRRLPSASHQNDDGNIPPANKEDLQDLAQAFSDEFSPDANNQLSPFQPSGGAHLATSHGDIGSDISLLSPEDSPEGQERGAVGGAAVGGALNFSFNAPGSPGDARGAVGGAGTTQNVSARPPGFSDVPAAGVGSPPGFPDAPAGVLFGNTGGAALGVTGGVRPKVRSRGPTGMSRVQQPDPVLALMTAGRGKAVEETDSYDLGLTKEQEARKLNLEAEKRMKENRIMRHGGEDKRPELPNIPRNEDLRPGPPKKVLLSWNTRTVAGNRQIEDIEKVCNLEYNLNPYTLPIKKVEDPSVVPFGAKYYWAGDKRPENDMKILRRSTNFVWPTLTDFRINNYDHIMDLAKGSYGYVELVRGKTDGKYYALKEGHFEVSKMTDLEEKFTMNEIFALSVLNDCQYITRFYFAWVEKEIPHFLLEYCHGINVEQLIKKKQGLNQPFHSSELLTLMLHVGLGLRHMHSRGIAHMDIKPSNILIQLHGTKKDKEKDTKQEANFYDNLMARILQGDGPYLAEDCYFNSLPVYKIADLGLATDKDLKAADLKDEKMWGDESYRAPEGFCMDDDYAHNNFNTSAEVWRSDMYSLGAVLVSCGICKPGTDVPPFPGKIQDMHAQDDFKQVVEKLMDTEPMNRLSAAVLVEIDMLNKPLRRSNLQQLNSQIAAQRLAQTAQNPPNVNLNDPTRRTSHPTAQAKGLFQP